MLSTALVCCGSSQSEHKSNVRATSARLLPVSGYAETFEAEGGGGPDGQVPAALRRPLSLPRVVAGQECPRTLGDTARELGIAEINPATVAPGKGPAYPMFYAGEGRYRPEERGAVGVVNWPQRQLVRGWGDVKAMWAISPSYEGPVLVRGKQLDGHGALGFGSPERPFRELQLPPGDRLQAKHRWRIYGDHLVLSRAGCYGMQMDTEVNSQVVVFEAAGPAES